MPDGSDNILLFRPNHRTAARLRLQREREKIRLCLKIGINLSDAPLFDEELRFLAYTENKNARHQ
jgi:hypothetical protein